MGFMPLPLPAVPPPVVSLSVPPGPLVAGGVEDILLTCSAMVNSTVVDVDVQDIRYVFTWQDSNGQDIVSGDRTIITSPPSSSSSNLTLSPLSTTDTNFTCAVIVSEVQNKVLASKPGSAVTSVNVVGEFPYPSPPSLLPSILSLTSSPPSLPPLPPLPHFLTSLTSSPPLPPLPHFLTSLTSSPPSPPSLPSLPPSLLLTCRS